MHRFFLTISVGLTLALAVCAQVPSPTPETKPDPELAKKAFKLLERVANDARSLRLAENRACVTGITADLFWERDEKRARALFRDAANDLIVAFGDNKRNKQDEWGQGNYNLLQTRTQLLQTIARRDPELALELMRATRPVFSGDGMTAMMNAVLNQERQLEQTLALEVLARDPKRALEIARESLAQGVSQSALQFLRKLQDKDREAATQFAGDIIQKLQTENLSRNLEAAGVAQILLRQLAGITGNDALLGPAPPAGGKPLAVDEKQLRDLAEVVVNAALSPSPFNFTGLTLRPLLPVIEKLLPERAAQLRQKISETEKSLPPGMKQMLNAANTDAAKAPETAFEATPDVPAPLRDRQRRTAIEKLVDAGNYDRAKQLISDKTEGRERDDLLAYLEKQRAAKALRDGQFDEAKQIAAATTAPGERAAMLAQLARTAFKKDPDLAQKTLGEALNSAPRYPDNYDDLRNLVEVIRASALIAPDKALDLLEPTIDLVNELVAASALLEKFSRNTTAFRDGELRFDTGFQSLGPIMQYGPDMRLLATASFDRTQALADRFRRDDMRLLARLLIAQSILAGKFGL